MGYVQQGGLQPDGERPERDVVTELKRDIIFGRLKTRERLLENEMAERFGVSRHVIRFAFDQLERAGLVERRANRGVIVYDYRTQEVEELYEMREILQRAAAERIPLPAPPELIDSLAVLNETFRVHLECGELAQAADANDRFHRTLFSACGNRFLSDSIEQYWLKTAAIHCYAIGIPNLARQSVREHEEMIEALRSGYRAYLVRVCIDHMRPALAAYKAAHGGWR